MFTIIGTTTFDLFLTGMDHIPGFGVDEFTPDSFAFLDDPALPVIGGNGANSAYVLATLGTPTALCSFVGNDAMGAVIKEWLEDRGVDTTGLVVGDDWATACTAIAIDRDSRRLTLHHSGGSDEFAPAMVPDAVLADTRGLLFSSYHLLPEFRRSAAVDLFREVKRRNGVTLFDFGPVIESIAEPGEFAALLTHVDFVIANEYELCSSAATPVLDEAAAAFVAAGCGAVVAKRGPEGAALYEAGGRHDVPAFSVEARGTVGAGDSFNAGFVHATIQGRSPAEAVVYGNAAAALVVASERGAMGAPTQAEVEALVSGS